jgi:hypothetical protein
MPLPGILPAESFPLLMFGYRVPGVLLKPAQPPEGGMSGRETMAPFPPGHG